MRVSWRECKLIDTALVSSREKEGNDSIHVSWNDTIIDRIGSKCIMMQIESVTTCHKKGIHAS